MDLDRVRIFHAVAEAGSFTHAGEVLSLSQSAVSRQVAALEESLGCQLFHRHARGLLLTEQGELLYQTAHHILAKLTMVEAQLSETKDRPQGPLKITTTIGFGSIWLTARLKEFLEHYPDIETTLILADSELDLGMREADVGIRMTPPTQSHLIQRQLMTMHFHIFASPDYLKAYGVPRSLADLDHHRIIAFGRETPLVSVNLDLLLEIGRESPKPRKPALLVNNIYGIYRAVRNGIGLGLLPDYLGNESDTLVRVLPDFRGEPLNIYFVYPEELRNSARIVALRDFLISKIGDLNQGGH